MFKQAKEQTICRGEPDGEPDATARDIDRFFECWWNKEGSKVPGIASKDAARECFVAGALCRIGVGGW